MKLLISKTINKFLFSNAVNSCQQSPLGCSNIQEFRSIMLDTFKNNKSHIEKVVDNQGLNSHLYLLQTLDDHQIPQSIYKRVINGLLNTDQKITNQKYQFLKQRLPNQKQLIQLYSKPQKQFTSQTSFKINNTTITTHLVEQSLSIDYQNYDKLVYQKASNVFDQREKEENTRGKLITQFRGDDMNIYIRGIISEHQLFYAEDIDEFLFKYNDKLLKHFPSNILFRYTMRSKKYPLEINLIDLPHIFIMEEICEKKSLKQLENTLEIANLLNLLCKLNDTKNVQLKCPKMMRKLPNTYLTMPDGYYPHLAQDDDLFSKNKVEYAMTKIDEIVKEGKNKKQQILLMLSNQYAPFIRQALKKYQESNGNLSHEKVTLQGLHQHIVNRNNRLDKQEELGVPLHKSIIAQLLFEVNTMETLEYYKSLGDEIAKQYFNSIRKYSQVMTLEALDQSAGQKLQNLFQKQPPCEMLEVLFGNQQQFPETAYTQETIKNIFTRLDSQTEQKGESGKIKINKQL